MRTNRVIVGADAIGALVVAAVLAFGFVRWLDDDPASAPVDPTSTVAPTETPIPTPTPRPIPQPPGPDVTPEPGATPDTTQPWWYVPWTNAERYKPLFDGTLAGVRIANGASGAAYVCDGEVLLSDKLSDAAGSPVDVRLPAVPPDIVLSANLAFPDGVLLCDGTPFSAGVRYSLDVDAEWSPFGGFVGLYRHYGEPVASLAIPAWRWEEREIGGGGLTVAVAHPILDDIGLGESAIVAYWDGVVTVIHADGIPFAKLLEIGEAMLGQ